MTPRAAADTNCVKAHRSALHTGDQMSLVPVQPRRRRPAAVGASLLVLSVAAAGAAAPAGAAVRSGAGHAAVQAAPSAAATLSAKAKAKANAKAAARRRKARARRSPAEGIVIHWTGRVHSDAPEAPALRIEMWESHTGTTSSAHELYNNTGDPSKSLEIWANFGISGYAEGRLTLPLRKRLKHDSASCDGWSDPWGPQYEADLLASRRDADALRRDPAKFAALPAGPVVGGRATKVATFDYWADNEPMQRNAPWQVTYDAATGDVLRSGLAGTESDHWYEYTSWEVLPNADASITEPPAAIKALCD